MSAEKPYLIAEILIKRGLPAFVIKEITALKECELNPLIKKWAPVFMVNDGEKETYK